MGWLFCTVSWWIKHQFGFIWTVKTLVFHIWISNLWECIAVYGMVINGQHRVEVSNLIGLWHHLWHHTKALALMHARCRMQIQLLALPIQVTGGSMWIIKCWQIGRSTTSHGFETTGSLTITVLTGDGSRPKLLNVLEILCRFGLCPHMI